MKNENYYKGEPNIDTIVFKIVTDDNAKALQLQTGELDLAPNFLPAILFMIVMNVRSAIAAESTLSFMGIGLPLETVSWGSMLSLSQRALGGRYWWMILIPGAFLVAALMCVTNIGSSLRKSASQKQRNL